MYLQRKIKILLRFFLPFLSVVMLVTAILSISYAWTLENIRRDQCNSMRNSAEHLRDSMEQRFSELNSFCYIVQANSNVRNFLSRSDINDDRMYYRMYVIMNLLGEFMDINHTLDRVYLYFQNIDVLISSETATTRPETYYDAFLRYEGIDSESWRADILSFMGYGYIQPARQSLYDNVRYVSFSYSLPLGNGEKWNACMVIEIDENKLFDGLDTIDGTAGLWAAMLDDKGQLMASIGNVPESMPVDLSMLDGEHFLNVSIQGENITLYGLRSSYNNWYYILAMPEDTLLSRVFELMRLFVVVLALVLIIGNGGAFLISRRMSRPVLALVDKLYQISNNEPINDEYLYIEKNIDSLAERNRVLNLQRLKQMPFMRAYFFENLFTIGYKNEVELNNMMQNLELKITGYVFMVAVVRLCHPVRLNRSPEDMMQTDVGRIELSNWLYERLSEHSIIHLDARHEDTLVILFKLNSDFDEQAALQLLTKELENLVNQCNLRATAGVGSVCERLLDVHQSYSEALAAAKIEPRLDQFVTLYRDIERRGNGFTYPIEMEARLIELIELGESIETEKQLHQIISMNRNRDQFSYERLSELNSALRLTLKRVMDQEDDPQPVPPDVLHLADEQECFNMLCALLIERSDRNRTRHIDSTAQRMVDYLQDNYTDPTLGLCKMADDFQLSESYLSSYFKENVGDSFFNYLERIRLKAACTLLESDRVLTQEAIASKVGYGSANTFYRAFKRVYGVTPSVYRKLAGKTNI